MDARKGEVVFENVTFTYPMRPEMTVLNDLSLRVPAGKVTALVGPSGSGKSTLASLLLRFYDPNQGRILLDGHDIRNLDATWLRKSVGTVSQEATLFSATVRQNIAYGSDKVDDVDFEQIRRAARQGIIHKLRDTCSQNPKLLIFDEATSALDTESEHLVKMALKRLIEEGSRTVMIIAHRLSTIINADQIAVISKGELKELGTYQQLLNIENGIFKKLIEKQTVDFKESFIVE